jgi:sugar O-acyltransferase (sialic acid O-acetyltransferase NeuD family)
MAKIVIFGTGQTAEIAYYYITNDSPYEIVAFTADAEFIKKDTFLGLPVVPFEEVEQKYPPDEFDMFIAMAYHDLNRLRAGKYREAESKKYNLISYVSSEVSIAGSVEIGNNCFILENQTIQPYSKIGNNVTIWSGNLIGHHVQIGDHCWITSEVSVLGNAIVEPYCFVGVNSTIGHMITIGRESFIGANCLITKDAKKKSVYITKPTELYPLDSDQFLKISKML